MRVLVLLVSLLVACGHAAESVRPGEVAPVGGLVDPPADLASVPHEGQVGGCTIAHTGVMYLASDMLVASPPDTDEHGLTRAAAFVTAHVECTADAPPGFFVVTGWITARGETLPVVAVRAQHADGTPWSFEVVPGASYDVDVLAQGTFLPPETSMRATLHWQAPDGTSIDLGTDVGWLDVAS